VPEFEVLARRQRLQHRPLLEQLALDLLHARQDLETRVEIVGGQVPDRGRELVDDELHPQLRRLVLDDEQHLVVVHRLRQRVLRREQAREVEVAAVGEAIVQVRVDTGFQRALVGVGHVGDSKPVPAD
jgi:hypothetical protein